MGIEATPPDHIAAGRRHPSGPEARQQRPGEQERGADPLRQLSVDLGAVDRRAVDQQLAGAEPLDPRAERLEQQHHRFDVSDPRHVAQDHLVVGEQARRQDRQGSVFVAGGHDRARQRHSAFDYELLQGLDLGSVVEGAVASGREPVSVAGEAGEGDPAGLERSARVTAMQAGVSRDQAWDLLCEWTQSDSLRRHMLAVECAMRAYAPRFDGDVELWGLTGLLHDLDYERYPDLGDGHPRHAIAELEARGYPPELVRAVASHADFMGVPRETPMEKTLFAVDELSGFILACAYVRPEGLVGMTPKSVKKKLKQPSFAAAVNRDDMRHGAEDLGVDFDEHLTVVIAALTERRDELMPATGAGESPAGAGEPATSSGESGTPAAADSPSATRAT